MPTVQRGADRAPGIAGRRLHPEAFERSLAQQSTVRNTVECDATCKACIALAGDCCCVSRHSKDDLLGHLLDRPGKVQLSDRDVALRLSRWSVEQFVEASVRHRQPPEETEVPHVHAE